MKSVKRQICNPPRQSVPLGTEMLILDSCAETWTPEVAKDNIKLTVKMLLSDAFSQGNNTENNLLLRLISSQCAVTSHK